jgi:hypothetical protein
MPGGFGFGPIRPWRTAGTPPALSPQRDPGASPRLAKSGRPLQCPSRTLHVSHERVSFTFPNCYAVDNGPGYPGHRVSYLFQTCRQPGPADPPERGCGGPGRRGQNGLVCPGWPPARKKLDLEHAGLGRVSAGRGATRLAGPGISGGFARTPAGTREGLGEGPDGRGTPPLATSRGLLAARRRARAISSLASHFTPAGHVRAGAGPGCSCPRKMARGRTGGWGARLGPAAGPGGLPLLSRSRNSGAEGLSRVRRRITLSLSRLVSAYLPGQGSGSCLSRFLKA